MGRFSYISLVDVTEELQAQPSAEVRVGVHGRAVARPRLGVQELRGAVPEAVAGDRTGSRLPSRKQMPSGRGA